MKNLTKLQGVSISFQTRDLALLRGLFESRIMTARHIAFMYFCGKGEYTKKRLQRIKAAGFISERKRRVNEPSILYLTRKAFSFLKHNGHLHEYPPLSVNSFEVRAQVGEQTLRHELEVMDVKAALSGAIANSKSFSILDFYTWPLLCQFETAGNGYGAGVLVRPDGFIRIHEEEEGSKGFVHECFLEVDRSSETQDTLVTRAGHYLDYYRSGGFAVRNGGKPEDFAKFPFRVLMVMKTAERRNNTAERLLQRDPPVLKQVWLATIEHVRKNPLGPIWMRPIEYRTATTGTRFDADRQKPSAIYRRNFERDSFVEGHVRKVRLLDSKVT